MSDGSRLLELMRCGAVIPREREMVYLSPTAPRNRNTHFSIRQIPMKPMCPYLLCALECAFELVPYFQEDQHSHIAYMLQLDVFHAWKLLTQITLPLQQVDTLIMTGCV